MKKRICVEDECRAYADKHLRGKFDWYVLHRDENTTEYLNAIDFKTYEAAKKEFDEAVPLTDADGICLIFSADEARDKYYVRRYGIGNILYEYKKAPKPGKEGFGNED